MRLRYFVTAFALASGMVDAMADTFDIGTLPIAPAVYSNVHNVQSAAPGGSFADLYSFVFPAGASTGSGSAVTINLGTILNIDFIQVALLDAAQSILAAGSLGAPGSVLFDQTLTPGTSYYFNVTGFATGSAGGTYAFLASAAPVPEPGTSALMLAGLGVVGSIVRRRRPS
jgi:PEP-CTERM motif